MGVYVTFNAAMLYVLPIPQLAASTLPAADAAEVTFRPAAGTFVTALAAVSLLGTRPRRPVLPEGGGAVNAGGTPWTALS